MAKITDLTIDDLEHLIEDKILEVLGDPDTGLKLRADFKQKLQSRLENPSRRISHKEVTRKIA